MAVLTGRTFGHSTGETWEVFDDGILVGMVTRPYGSQWFTSSVGRHVTLERAAQAEAEEYRNMAAFRDAVASHPAQQATINPDDYVTPYDAMHTTYKEEQYERGLKHGQEGWTIHIAENGVWSAERGLGHIQSYERIGDHACTADLVRGWIDGGATIVDHRTS